MSESITNRQFRLARRPEGVPDRDDFELTSENLPEAGEGEVRVAVEYISLDPAMRGWMSEGKSYIAPVGLGAVMRAGGAGTVIDSRHSDFKAGDKVRCEDMGIQTHAVIAGENLQKVDTSIADLHVYTGALGMPGMTAYFGTIEVGKVQRDDVVLVSAASGAVGQLVGQIARKMGASRVVGIAGGEKKCRYVVDELGFDAAIDYKNEDINEAVTRECPDGIDVFYDNVGGEILDAALANLRWRARVVICGAISQYNVTGHVGDTGYAPKNYMSLLINRARMEGFIVFDFMDQYDEAAHTMAEWIKSGDLKHREDIVEGFDSFPETLQKLFSGDNFGKLVLAVEH